jgi:hypothetical protein
MILDLIFPPIKVDYIDNRGFQLCVGLFKSLELNDLKWIDFKYKLNGPQAYPFWWNMYYKDENNNYEYFFKQSILKDLTAKQIAKCLEIAEILYNKYEEGIKYLKK